MSEVNLNLKFQVTNAKSVDDIADKIDKLELRTRKKFQLELDTDNFVKNLNTLQTTLNRIGKDTGLVSNIKNIATAFNSLNNTKVDVDKVKAFVDSVKSINASELKQIAGSLNSLGNALNKLTGVKPPSMATFLNSIQKLAESNVDLKKIENILVTMEHFKSITFDMKGLSDFKDIVRVINNLNKIGVDDETLIRFKKILEVFNGINTDVNLKGLSSIPTMIKNMEGLDKININEQDFLNKMQVIQKGLNILSKTIVDNDKSKSISDMMKGFSGLKGLESLERIKLDENKFLAKMATIRKGFEELSQAKIDVAKMQQMAEAMKSIAEINRNNKGNDSFSSFGGIAGLVGSYFSIQSVANATEQAKQLEYAILQVGVAGELSSQQMKDLKQVMFEMSAQSGKTALDVTNAMDAIIKTGQSLENSKFILDAALKTSVATGE